MKKLNKIYFSPTGTTKRILNAISINLKFSSVRDYNIQPNNTYHDVAIDDKSVTIIGIPVYSGRVPTVIIEEFKKFTSNRSPVVLVVVYGNRHYDDALLELKNIATDCGFNVIAAAAFVAEHSFSTKETPLAKNRPDIDDFMKCKEFASLIKDSIANKDSKIAIPGNFPYKDRSAIPLISPETDSNICTLCGECVDVCPTDAITITDKVETNKELCIWCCACTKICPSNGRTFNNEIITNLQTKLSTLCKDRREVEIFTN